MKLSGFPTWGRDRIYGMVENRPDWCISRQRLWGVPITVFYCAKCKNEVLTQGILDHLVELVEKGGADIWFEKEPKDLMPKHTICPHCKNTEFTKEVNILDVWFDSGVSHAAVLEKRQDLSSPCDMYLEGSDQHRGWFHSSLLESVGTGNAVVKSHLRADGGSLADHHARPMIDEERLANRSAGIDIDPRMTVCNFRHHAGKERHAHQVEAVRQALHRKWPPCTGS